MARETNSIATVWDIDYSNGLRTSSSSLDDDLCCMKSNLSGANAYWRNTIIPTTYSSDNMHVKFGDISFAPVYSNGFSTTYVKSGTVSLNIYKWVKISNLGVNITYVNGATPITSLPYTMSAYTNATTLPIPYTVCSGDKVTFVVSAATFTASTTSTPTGGDGLSLSSVSGFVTQQNSNTFLITGANATLNPQFVLYSNVDIDTGITPTPDRTVTIKLSHKYGISYIYGIRVGGLTIATGTTEAEARAEAQNPTGQLILSTILNNLELTGRYSKGSIITEEEFQIPSTAYMCIIGETNYPQVPRTSGLYSWISCDWYSGATTGNTVQVTDNTFIIPPSQNEFWMIAG